MNRDLSVSVKHRSSATANCKRLHASRKKSKESERRRPRLSMRTNKLLKAMSWILRRRLLKLAKMRTSLPMASTWPQIVKMVVECTWTTICWQHRMTTLHERTTSQAQVMTLMMITMRKVKAQAALRNVLKPLPVARVESARTEAAARKIARGARSIKKIRRAAVCASVPTQARTMMILAMKSVKSASALLGAAQARLPHRMSKVDLESAPMVTLVK